MCRASFLLKHIFLKAFFNSDYYYFKEASNEMLKPKKEHPFLTEMGVSIHVPVSNREQQPFGN